MGDGAERSVTLTRFIPHATTDITPTGEGELMSPNSKRVQLEKAGELTKTYSQNKPLP